MWQNLRRFFTIVLTTSCLFGCIGDQASRDLKEYQQRLANIVEADFERSEPVTTLTYPPISQLKILIPETTVNLRDFYAIQNCAVNTLIAQRNTALGKTQLPSTRYHYEVQLLQGLEQCALVAESDKVKKQLNDWIEIKRSSFPQVWLNLVQTSQEVKQAFSSNQGYLNQGNSEEIAEFKLALEYLVDLSNQTDVEIEKLESSLNTLRQTELAARLWKTQLLLKQELSATTAFLINYDSEISCSNAANKQQLDYLKNVFQRYFIERIQPLAGVVDKSNYALAPVLNELLNTAGIHPDFKHYLRLRLSEYEEYKSAMHEHVVFWQSLFKRCSLSPQS